AAKKPLLGGLIGYEMNGFLQDYGGKIGVFLLLLFGLVVILVRLFQFSPDTALTYLNKKGKSLASEFNSTPTTTQENKTSFTKEKDNEREREKELPLVIDTYTHKKDIPLLEKDDIDEDFQIKVGAEEEPIAMEIEKI